VVAVKPWGGGGRAGPKTHISDPATHNPWHAPRLSAKFFLPTVASSLSPPLFFAPPPPFPSAFLVVFRLFGGTQSRVPHRRPTDSFFYSFFPPPPTPPDNTKHNTLGNLRLLGVVVA